MEILYHRRPYVVSIFLEIEPWKMGHTLLIEEILHQKDACLPINNGINHLSTGWNPINNIKLWDFHGMFTTNWWISQPLPLGVPRYRPPNTAGRSGPRRPGGGRRDAADDGAERRPGRTAPAAAAKAGGGHGRPTPGATGRFGATGLETCNARTSGEDSYIIHTYIYIYI